MTSPTCCPVCRGDLAEGTTTFTADFGLGLVVVRRVPAQVCQQCGEAWIQDDVAARLESLVLEAKAKGRQFEVIDLAA
jgi:YgiT-type zinc finger domain-containing protein